MRLTGEAYVDKAAPADARATRYGSDLSAARPGFQTVLNRVHADDPPSQSPGAFNLSQIEEQLKAGMGN